MKTILIVEDDPGIGQYISLAISQETPYLPLLVTDSVRALEVVKHIRPNLFMLDQTIEQVFASTLPGNSDRSRRRNGGRNDTGF